MGFQCSDNKNKSIIFVYNFNEKYEKNYSFINVNNKCNAGVAVSKKWNADRYLNAVYKGNLSQYPNNSEILRKSRHLTIIIWLNICNIQYRIEFHSY
jgi:hypothetical protein